MKEENEVVVRKMLGLDAAGVASSVPKSVCDRIEALEYLWDKAGYAGRPLKPESVAVTLAGMGFSRAQVARPADAVLAVPEGIADLEGEEDAVEPVDWTQVPKGTIVTAVFEGLEQAGAFVSTKGKDVSVLRVSFLEDEKPFREVRAEHVRLSEDAPQRHEGHKGEEG